MNSLSPQVKENYDYSLHEYNPSDDRQNNILSEKEVFDAYFILSDFFLSVGEIAEYGILNFNMLSSAVARQSVGMGNEQKWTQPLEKIATLVFGLVKNHSFKDGNKRIALLSMIIGLHKIYRQLKCSHHKLEELLVRIASNQMDEYDDYKRFLKYGDDATIEYIAHFLRRNSKKVDNTFRAITYEEFNTKLRTYGIRMENPQGAYIDVMQIVEEKKILGIKIPPFGKKEPTTKRLLQIGFPGWKRQINPKAFKSVLSEAGLTSVKGIDLKTFYEGTEPEYKLIEEYFEILKRLKDR